MWKVYGGCLLHVPKDVAISNVVQAFHFTVGILQFDFTQYKKSLIDWVAMCQHGESYHSYQKSIDVNIAWDFTSEVAKKESMTVL